MKRFLYLILALVMCLSLYACSDDTALFREHLEGKEFESDGRTLSFFDENHMSYHFINGMGNEFYYVFIVQDLELDGNKLHFNVIQVAENDDSETIDKGKKEKVTYNVDDNTIKYYGNIYK